LRPVPQKRTIAPEGRPPKMTLESKPLQLGGEVPNFELALYDPLKNDFGTISLDEIKSQGKWTICHGTPKSGH
jgi:hypothetical protein